MSVKTRMVLDQTEDNLRYDRVHLSIGDALSFLSRRFGTTGFSVEFLYPYDRMKGWVVVHQTVIGFIEQVL